MYVFLSLSLSLSLSPPLLHISNAKVELQGLFLVVFEMVLQHEETVCADRRRWCVCWAH
jgi:hypothetical protein